MNERTAGLSRRIAEFTEDFSFGDASGNVIENAKVAILDNLACAVLAGAEEIGAIVRSYAEECVPGGTCTVWGTDLTVGLRDAGFLNGLLAHGLDYDDRGHSTTYLLATSFTATEALTLSGARLLEAFIVGREVRQTLEPVFSSRHFGEGPGARGWHGNGIFGAVASACAAAKLFGLDRAGIANAVGLAAGSCGALTRDGGTMAKPFRTGQAAANGIMAVQLAKHGLFADSEAIEGETGLLDAIGPISDEILASLGKALGCKFSLNLPIEAKVFATGGAAHAPIEAMLRLRKKSALRLEDIQSIDCDLKLEIAVRDVPQRGYEGHFSVRFSVAMALVCGRLDARDFTDKNVADVAVQTAMGLVRHVAHSKQLVVTLKSGERLVEPLQAAEKLTDWSGVEKKFRGAVSGILSKAKADAVVNGVAGLERLATINELAAALRVG